MRKLKVALDSLGCKLNQAETEDFARKLAEAGYSVVSSVDEADIYVLNTCTVTHIADRKSRHMLRMAHRCNPGARLIALGCYAGRAPQELSGIDGVEMVLGNDRKSRLLEYLKENDCPVCDMNSTAEEVNNHLRTRALVKVQEGCVNFCAYCIVPYVRRGEQSVPPDSIINELKRLAADGYQEVVLTGTKIGSYSYEGVNLRVLLERVLAETDIPRIRISSLQPQEMSRELVGLWQNSRLCPHFHLSLQSGSDAVLRRMKRRYTAAGYRQSIAMIRDVVPEAAVTTDIIVGFPGETDEEFSESLLFCEDTGFARIHVFPYSSRHGTEAAQMPHKVGSEVKKRRSRDMLALAEKSSRNYHERFIGKTVAVLWEQENGGVWSGLTGNYIRIYARSRRDLVNRLTPVYLKEESGNGLRGEIREEY